MTQTSDVQRFQPRRLVLVFLAWKVILLLIAIFSPGPGYDTSALIASDVNTLRHSNFKHWPWFERLALNLFRWDALYFVKSAQRGYAFEQEWAFSWAYSLLLNTGVKLFTGGADATLDHYIWTGVAVSNICHLLSTLVLFHLLNTLLGPQQNGRLAFVASVLHILSPAGMFLSSPYAEALFALLNFTGILHYVQSTTWNGLNRPPTLREDTLMLSSALFFTLATWIRSNGLLSGSIYLYDVAIRVPKLLGCKLHSNDIRRLSVTCIAGVLLAIGSVIPQYVAYREYCVDIPPSYIRPWCYKTIPSIYTWVQSTYWNVGFLRYWTLPNLPLFFMAAPMLVILVRSSMEYLYHHRPVSSEPRGKANPSPMKDVDLLFGTIPQLAVPQLVLALIAATNFHVQVINRLASGYPLWYLSMARWLIMGSQPQENQISQWVCRGLIMYAMVQGALFANFLPPA